MNEDKIRKNQESINEETLNIYNIEAFGGGVEEPVIGDDLIVLKPGIRLHFLRYGLFDKNVNKPCSSDITAPPYEDPKFRTVYFEDGKKHYDYNLKLGEIPILSGLKTENFSLAYTSLKTGYIYLINEDDENDYKEFYVDETGRLQNIIWNFKKDSKGNYIEDIRNPSGECLDYIWLKYPNKDNPGKKYWIAFSTVQWSRETHYEFNTNKEKRKKRMILVDCSGINKCKQDEHENAMPFTSIVASFNDGDLRANRLDALLHTILADEERQDKEDEENELYEDMFIHLDDPIGCALDVANVLGDKVAGLEALVESIGVGKDPKDIKERIIDGKIKPELTKADYEEEQISTLVATALTTYQLVYNDDEMIEKYDGGKEGAIQRIDIDIDYYYGPPLLTFDGNGIYKQKLLDILAVKERRELRKEIVSYRYDFACFLQSKYYTKYFEDFTENGFIGLLEGAEVSSGLIRLLSIDPDSIDGYLDLKKHRGKYADEVLQKKHDDAKAYFLKHLKENKKVHAVLEKDLDLNFFDENEGVLSESLLVNLSNKFGRYFSSNLSNSIKYANLKKEKVLPFVFSKLHKFTHKDGFLFEFLTKELDTQLAKNGVVLSGELKNIKHPNRFKNGYTVFKADQIELIDEYKHNSKGSVKLPTTDKKITKNIKKMERVLNNVHFAKGLCVLQVLNVSSAGYQFYDSLTGKNGSFNYRAKSFVNLVGVGGQLTGAINNFKRVNALALGNTETANSLVTKVEVFNKVGAYVTVLICTWDATESFCNGDNDAAIAWAFAGGLFFAGIFVSGPLGWVIGGLAIGFVYLANYLKDSPLEKYFKHYWLSDVKAFPRIGGEPPWKYNKRLYANREKLIRRTVFDSDKYEKQKEQWEDLRVCHQELLDLMVCNVMYVSESAYYEERFLSIGGQDGRAGATFAYKDVKRISIQTNFNQFLWFEEQFEYKIYIVKRDGRSGELWPNELNPKKSLIRNAKDRPTGTKVTFDIPKWIHEEGNSDHRKDFRSYKQLLFICQLVIDKSTNQYYPHTYVGDTRYMGIKIKLSSSRLADVKNMEGMLMEPQPKKYVGSYYKNVKVASKEDLLKWGTEWELNF